MMNLPSEIWYWELIIYGKEKAPNPLIFSDLHVSEFEMHRLFSNFEAARTQIGIVREKLCEKFNEIFDFTIHDLDGSKDYYHGGIMTKNERVVLLITLTQQKACIYNQPKTNFI